MKKVIITGASGFIGYALTRKLLLEGVEVWAIVRRQSEQSYALEKMNNCHVILCDLNENTQIPKLIQQTCFDAFYHFAWQGVANEDSCNLDIQLSNIKITCQMVEIAHKLECKKFIFASSIMEYELDKLIATDLYASNRNIYRAAKRMATVTSRIYCNNLSIDYNSAIISNVFGPEEYSERFIISTLKRMLRGEKCIFTEAKQLYDFCYIDDAVEILKRIGEKGKDNHDYYVGNAKPEPLREYITRMRDCVDSTLNLEFGGNKDFIGVTLEYNEFDIHSSEAELGFDCKVEFEDGILRTINWLREQDKKKV